MHSLAGGQLAILDADMKIVGPGADVITIDGQDI
jgi:hypothetical protein